jgi:cation diffusion facilitator CzcD-associated flavoprotein CzcO
MTREVDVAIVGAGFGGLAMASALRRAGRESFAVLDRGSSVGGTWRDNTYPGVACDVPSHLYGLENHPWPDWSGLFARGDEIHRYLQHIAEAEHLGERLLLEHGALKHLVNHAGHTARDIAASHPLVLAALS